MRYGEKGFFIGRLLEVLKMVLGLKWEFLNIDTLKGIPITQITTIDRVVKKYLEYYMNVEKKIHRMLVYEKCLPTVIIKMYLIKYNSWK